MRIGVLGPVEARRDGAVIDLGPPKQRALLAALALHRGHPVSPDALVGLIWGSAAPASAGPTLQAYVARLRQALEPDRPARTPAEVLVTRLGGYALVLPDGALDVHAFETAVEAAHRAVGSPPLTELASRRPDQPTELRIELDRILRLWRGQPYADLGDAPAAATERRRLEELRVLALEDRAIVSLALGQDATVVADLEPLTAAYPLRERLWGLQAVALTRSGRQADALELLRRVRELLAEELGIEPGADLRALQTAILRQDVEPLAGAATPRPRPAWPLVGRQAQLAALEAAYVEAAAGRPAFAVVTGEPGIGKSRLVAELAAHAEDDGAVVVLGRCSQDDGAPPLWPWASVLRDLGAALPAADGATATPFAVWAGIVETVREAATARPLVVVLDDLHWADLSSLRVLRLLAETVDAGRLLLAATWRDQPAPTGALAEAAESLARRHAVRVKLTGLGAAESARVVAAVGAHLPSPAEAGDLRRRTDGNPFFLVEYARLARERGDLGVLLAEDGPPAAVTDVVARRVGALPGATARALRGASVAGRDFDLDTLAAALGRPHEKVLDDLDPALAAGLVREDGVDRFRFAHALVRDTVYAGLTRSRSARWHAVLASVVSERPGRESEEARHWLAAGPAYARAAWRACLAAAARARQLFAYEEASALLAEAAEAIEGDPSATREERCDLLLDQAAALQLAGDWEQLRPVVHRAVAAATDLDDMARVVRAAGVPLTGALWQSTYHDDLDQPVVDALRLALDRLPDGDGEDRCRAMASLAATLYYATPTAEREDLARDSLAMARRLGDRALLVWCCLTMATTTWRAGNAEARLGMLDEAVAAAHETGDRLSGSSAMTLRAVAYAEVGRITEMEEAIAAARVEAESLRHLYAQLVLDSLEAPWLAMRGDLEGVDARIAHLAELAERLSLPQAAETVASARMSRMTWSGQEAELVEVLDQFAAASPLPLAAVRAAMAGRAGQVDRIEALLAEPLELDSDTWFSPVTWATTAEAALYVGRADLAATAYDRLSRRGGRTVSTGSGAMLGPTEAFLALAAVTTGDRDRAARHADEALALCWAWRIPLVAAWLTDLRERFDF